MSKLAFVAGATLAASALLGLSAHAAPAKPRQLVTQFSCAEASSIENDLGKASKLSADLREEVSIVSTKCGVDQHNREHPDQLRMVLVTPDSRAPATANKTFLRSVNRSDADTVRDFCVAAGEAVITDSGAVPCEAYVKGDTDSMVVLAPASVGGVAVTTRVLALIGSGDPDGHLPYATKRLAKATRGSTANSAKDAADNPVVEVASTGGGGTGSGTGGQFMHASKCLTTLGFGSGCDKK